MTKSKNRNKKRVPLIVMGVLLIAVSTFLLAYQMIQMKQKKEKAIELENIMEKNITLEKESLQDIKVIKEVRGYEEADELNESNALGVVRIDKIKVVLPIYGDTSNKSLLGGAGIVEKTDLPTSDKNKITVLAGHRGGRNESQSFLNIHKLEKGDEIKITTREQILYYKVVEEEVVEASDWSKFIREEEKTKLYLMSCHPYPHNYQRLLIKSELVKQVDKEEDL